MKHNPTKASINTTHEEKKRDENDDDGDDDDELVQRQLQLRMEAQKNYLKSALERAQEMLENDCRSSDSGSCLTCEDAR